MSGPDLSWFPIYPRDFMSHAAVQAMTLDELGAYWKLICYAWQEESIPGDLGQLAIICGVTPKRMVRLWGKVKPCWVASAVTPGRLINPRQEEERATAWDKYNKRANSGRRGGLKKASNASSNASSTALATHNSQPTNTVTDVPNGTAAPDAETWNARLAPHARRLGGSVGDWLKWAKSCGADTTKCDDIESWMWGLWKLREIGALEWIPKGQDVTPAVFRTPTAKELIRDCEMAYRKYAPNPGAQIVGKITGAA